jgi:hypothetical protein
MSKKSKNKLQNHFQNIAVEVSNAKEIYDQMLSYLKQIFTQMA